MEIQNQLDFIYVMMLESNATILSCCSESHHFWVFSINKIPPTSLQACTAY